MAKIGAVGLGIMGGGMARNLARAGHQVTGWTRSADKTSRELNGVILAGSVGAAVRDADFVLISVTGPEAQHAVIGAAAGDGVLAHAPRGALVLDATTTDPELSRVFADAFADRGVAYADAPVFGSKTEAWDGKLDVMFGGSDADFERAKPLLEAIGKTVTHVGGTGTAMSLKLIGNLMVANQFMSLAEGMALAQRTGVAPETLAHVLDHVDFGSGLLRANARTAAQGDFTAFFQLKDMVKDARLVEDLGRRVGVPMLSASVAAQVLAGAMNAGHGRENVSALVAYVEAQSRTVRDKAA
jgi:3-hydroxyisobutyrate dehydrogenase-like beta-hydroxyacid dehydrogenase